MVRSAEVVNQIHTAMHRVQLKPPGTVRQNVKEKETRCMAVWKWFEVLKLSIKSMPPCTGSELPIVN